MHNHRQNSFPSQSIQVQCSTDKISVLPTEILVLPDDYRGENEAWLQDAIVNKKSREASGADLRRNVDFIAIDATPVTYYQEVPRGGRTD